ncbi:hypothetical protein ACFQ08_14750 [Streptosporangium algeriense]|uniref:Polymerase nucleotidyl transferase domain-containing protein n=1 Tax=Streptosporangium algeriense TaxID=1682748 RepID=A0ABW3DPK7_9ACTN
MSRIYLGGAPTAGLGSPMSDIDLFVVRADCESPPPAQLEFEGERADVEYLDLEQLRRDVQESTVFRVTNTDFSQTARFSRNRLDVLTRFLLGEVVVDDGELAALRRRLADNMPDYKRLLIARHAIDAHNLNEDICGAILNGDAPATRYLSQEFLHRATEAYLCMRDDLYVNTKWIWARWRRSASEPLKASLTEVIDHAYTAEGDVVRRNRFLGQDLLVMAATGLEYVPVPGAEPRHHSRRTGVSVIPMRGGGVLIESVRGESVLLSWQGALLWGVSHGRTKEEAVHLMGGALASAGLQVGEDEIAAYHASLVDVGVIGLP